MAMVRYWAKEVPNVPVLGKKKRAFLERLDLELTERCNNNCIHCNINLPADDGPAMKRELPTEAIKSILKEAVSLGCLVVRFTGGEPLLREDFSELYLHARKLGLKVLLFTNATLLTAKLAEIFRRIPPLENIEITIYGMSQRSYEAVTRHPGSFERAWKGVHLLLAHNIPFLVKGVLLPFNRDERKEFETWAARIPWMSGPPSWVRFFDPRGRRDHGTNCPIKRFRISKEEWIRELASGPEGYRRDMRRFLAQIISLPGPNLFSCGAGVGRGCVDAYGFFQPCLTLREPTTVFDLRRGTLKEALTVFFPQLRERKATNPQYLRRCARCFLRNLCEQCPGKSWMENGTLDTPVEYYCEMIHAEGRYFGLLQGNEVTWEVEDWRERIRIFLGDESPKALDSPGKVGRSSADAQEKNHLGTAFSDRTGGRGY